MNNGYIESAILNARNSKSKLPEEILNINGMSSRQGRHLLNNLLSKDGLRYLEVGCWRGSTCCAAMYGNKPSKCVLIDNFSEFQEWNSNGVGVKDELLSNISKYGVNCEFINHDFYTLDLSSKGKFDIYFYDGAHWPKEQYDALEYAFESMADTFIYIVDDYNLCDDRVNIKKSLNDSIESMRSKIEIIGEYVLERDEGIWWHGLYIGLFKKKV